MTLTSARNWESLLSFPHGKELAPGQDRDLRRTGSSQNLHPRLFWDTAWTSVMLPLVCCSATAGANPALTALQEEPLINLMSPSTRNTPVAPPTSLHHLHEGCQRASRVWHSTFHLAQVAFLFSSDWRSSLEQGSIKALVGRTAEMTL